MDLIEENSWVLLKLPNKHTRLQYVRKGEQVQLGRYGNFAAELMIGLETERCYEIRKDKTLVLMEDEEEELTLEASSVEEMTTNQYLVDDNTSQQLGAAEVEALKASGKSSTELLEALVQGSKTFSQKNAFAQRKYLLRKTQKHSRWFRPSRLTASSLSNQLSLIREDVLGHLMMALDVQHGGRYALWDEHKFIVAGAILERCPGAEVIALHRGSAFQPGALTFLKLADANNLLPLSLDAPLAPFEPKTAEAIDSPAHHRHQRRYEKQQRATQEGGGPVDGLLIASTTVTPLSLLKTLKNRLEPCARVVLYHRSSTPLLPSYEYMRQSSEFLDVRLEEAKLLEWLPEPGRMHPLMVQEDQGLAGFILTGTFVLSPASQ